MHIAQEKDRKHFFQTWLTPIRKAVQPPSDLLNCTPKTKARLKRRHCSLQKKGTRCPHHDKVERKKFPTSPLRQQDLSRFLLTFLASHHIPLLSIVVARTSTTGFQSPTCLRARTCSVSLADKLALPSGSGIVRLVLRFLVWPARKVARPAFHHLAGTLPPPAEHCTRLLVDGTSYPPTSTRDHAVSVRSA